MKNQKGITLIALVITIIVMLILVAVSITVALNGGLFNYAKEGTTKTNTAKTEEMTLDNGMANIGGTSQDIGTYVNTPYVAP